MKNWLQRTQLLLGEEKTELLSKKNILILGLGGVGSFAAEFLARSGVGNMTIVDGDIVDVTNINRQLVALHSTIGKSKAEIMAERIKDINPNINLNINTNFILPEMVEMLISKDFDYVLECIDSITPKITVIQHCRRNKIPLISAMGAGGRTDASKISVSDIQHTKQCPLAQTVKKRLKKIGIRDGVKVVYSYEAVDKNTMQLTDGTNFKKSYYGTSAFIPAAFGLHMASFVVRKLIGKQ
jgi:tRNA A37 threonylcarbamoyladenosine dehydratase